MREFCWTKHRQKKKDNEKPKQQPGTTRKNTAFFLDQQKMRQQNCDGNFWELFEGLREFCSKVFLFRRCFFSAESLFWTSRCIQRTNRIFNFGRRMKKKQRPTSQCKKKHKQTYIGVKEKLLCYFAASFKKRKKHQTSLTTKGFSKWKQKRKHTRCILSTLSTSWLCWNLVLCASNFLIEHGCFYYIRVRQPNDILENWCWWLLMLMMMLMIRLIILDNSWWLLLLMLIMIRDD